MRILKFLEHFSIRKTNVEDPRFKTIFFLCIFLMTTLLLKFISRRCRNLFVKNDINEALKIKDSKELIKALPQIPSLVAAYLQNRTTILLEINAFPNTLLKNKQFFKLITKIVETLNISTEKFSKTTRQEILKICFDEDQINILKYENETILELLEKFEKSSKPIIRAKRAICIYARDSIHISRHVYPQLKSFDNIQLGYQGGLACFKVLFEELHLKFENVCSDVCKQIVLNEKLDKESLLDGILNNTEFKVGDTLRSNGLELMDYHRFDGFNKSNS